MSEEDSDELKFLYRMEGRLWQSLQSDGLSDDEIWNLLEKHIDDDDISSFGRNEYRAKALGEIHDTYEKLTDDDYSQTAAEWVTSGFLIMMFAGLAGMERADDELVSKRNSDFAKNPRPKRTTLALRAIAFVLREAPEFPGLAESRYKTVQDARDANYKTMGSSRGRQINRFRHFVGSEYRLKGKNIDVEVTAIEDHAGKVTQYEFFDNRSDERQVVKEGSLRKLINRVSKRMGQD